MIPVLAVFMSLAGPLFWRDAAETCDAAVELMAQDLQSYAPSDLRVMLVHFDCDEDKRQDGLARPFFRLTTASGKPPVMQIFWPAPTEDESVPAPDDAE